MKINNILNNYNMIKGKSEKSVCIIPARGGSKRIPRKNIKDFFGKPIIYYSIKKAIESKCFDEIMVSTDDNEIKNIALKYGAKVPFMRTKENAEDKIPIKDVIIEVLKKYQELGKTFNYACCIFPTAPLLNVENIISGHEKIKSYDYVFAVSPFSFPIQRSLIIKNMSAVFKFPDYINTRSQDLECHYQDSGQLYWININNLFKTKEIYSVNNYAIILNELQVQDIDNETDWIIAEMKYKLLK